jgi:hypothetical protein
MSELNESMEQFLARIPQKDGVLYPPLGEKYVPKEGTLTLAGLREDFPGCIPPAPSK